jgi:hypothetical protein
MLDAPELQTSLAMELSQDFVTETVNTYMPEAQQWCERGRGMFVPQDAFDKIKDDVAKDDKLIFDAMKASNLYSEIQKGVLPGSRDRHLRDVDQAPHTLLADQRAGDPVARARGQPWAGRRDR